MAVLVVGMVVVAVPTALVVMGWFSASFELPPGLAGARAVVAAVAAVPAALLMRSLTVPWFEVEDYDLGTVEVVDGRHGPARAVVIAGCVCTALAVAGVYGRRNWAPSALVVAWGIFGAVGLMALGGLESSTTLFAGMRTATQGLAALTVHVCAGVVLRHYQLSRIEQIASTASGRGAGR